MTQVRRTFDTDFIKSLVSDPENYDGLTDDGSVSAKDYEPMMNEAIYYIELGEGEGVALLSPTNSVSYDFHICMQPSCRGKEAIKLGKEMIEWMFENTPCRKINARVPFSNPKVLHYGIALGLEHEGTDRQSFLKNGILYDQHIIGIRR